MTQALDQDVVNLAKSIRQVETGNRPVSGASGELASRYQYMPATWKSTAQKYLGDANAPLTLENENKATYLKIKDWKDSGLKPDQIASMWNSGKPDWQGKVGVNSAGVKYDVPGYVSKVGAEYKKIKGSAPTPTPAPAPISENKQSDIESGKQYGAFLPANTEKPNIIAEGAKTIANIPSSAFNFAKGALDMINPISTVKRIGETISGFKELAREAGGAGKAALAFGKELPGAAYELVPEAARGLVTAGKGAFTGDEAAIDTGLKTAQRAITNDPVGQILPFLAGAKGGATILDRTGATKGAGAFVDRSVSRVAAPVIGAAKSVASKVTGSTKGAVKFGIGQATGLAPETISQITKTPEAFSKESKATIDRGSLGREVQSSLNKKSASLQETGSEYKPVRESGAVVKVDPNFVDSIIKEVTGLKLKNEKLQSSGSAVIREASDVRALQYIRDFWKPIFEKGELTADEFLNFRTDLGNLAKFERQVGKSKPLESMAGIVRARLNEAYRPQIEGLSKLDESFGAQSAEYKRLSKGFVDKNGNLTDAAINRIANAAGKGKDLLLAKIEEVAPGITQKIKILKAIEDIQAASGIKVGTYSRAALTGGAFVFGNIPAAIITAILTSPELAVPILRGAGMLRNAAVVKNVIRMLKEGAEKINQLPNAGQSEPKKIIPQELTPGKQKVNVNVVEPKPLMLEAPKEGAPRVSVSGKETINLGKKSQSTIDAEEIAIAQKQNPGASKVVEGEYTAPKVKSKKSTVFGKKQSAPAKATPKDKNISDPLIQEAKKYKTAEEFVNGADLRKSIINKTVKPTDTVSVFHGTPYWEDIISGGKGIRSGVRRNTPSALGGRVYASDGFDNALTFSKDQPVAFRLETFYDNLKSDITTVKNSGIKNTVEDSLLKGGAITLPNDSFGIKSVVVKSPDGQIFEFPYKTKNQELINKIKDVIYGKSQLTDIWNKANKKSNFGNKKSAK